MRRAFVTGGTGFLGLHIVEQLSNAGWQVTALHRKTSDITRLTRFSPQLTLGSIDDRASLLAAIPENCDAIFHVAANTNYWRGGNEAQTRDNVDGTRNMVDAALARGAKVFIHTSSMSAFGPQDIVPFDETAKSCALESPVNYEKTKYQAELEVMAGIERGLRAVILNPSHILGKYDVSNWSRTIRLVHERKLPGIPPGAGSWCHAGEVARAHIRAVDHGRVGQRYLLGGVDATYLEVFTLIGKIANRKVPKRAMPIQLLAIYGALSDFASRFTNRAPEVTHEVVHMLRRPMLVRSDKAVKELDYRSKPLEEMIRETYDWMKEERLLE